MIKTLKIKEDSKLHKLLGYSEIEMKKFTLLMGPNGVGKSSILQGVASKTDKYRSGGYYGECGNAIEVIADSEFEMETLRSREDNGKYRGYFGDDLSADLQMLFQSEGQSTMTMLMDRVGKLIEKLKREPEKKFVFLIDELDSGVSFDNILQIINFLKTIQMKFSQLQIIMTAHNYEFARCFPENTIWVPAGQYFDMSKYDVYQRLYQAHLFVKSLKSENTMHNNT